MSAPFELDGKIFNYLDENFEKTVELIEALCSIPAPSGMEEKRSEFCKSFLEAAGAKGVYIDTALNTVFPINCDGRDDIIVFLAHTDTVFPDTSPMPFLRDGGYLKSPGIGDDTAPLAMMLKVAEFITREKLSPSCGILIVANAGEEGLTADLLALGAKKLAEQPVLRRFCRFRRQDLDPLSLQVIPRTGG